MPLPTTTHHSMKSEGKHILRFKCVCEYIAEVGCYRLVTHDLRTLLQLPNLKLCEAGSYKRFAWAGLAGDAIEEQQLKQIQSGSSS